MTPETPSSAPIVRSLNSTLNEVTFLYVDSVAGSTMTSVNLQVRSSIDSRWIDLTSEGNLRTKIELYTEKGEDYELRYRV